MLHRAPASRDGAAARRARTRVSLPLEGLQVLDLSGCCPAASARCCSPTSAPTCSRSRTPAWATTSAGRRPTTRARDETRRARRLFLALNRNKRSIRIDLKNERGREVLLRLVARRRRRCSSPSAPACSTASASATSALREDNPGLVYCAITGYGQDGPNRDRSGHDMNYLGLDRPARAHRRARTAPPVQAGRPDRRPRRRRADGGVRDPRRAARARPLRARASSSTSRWPTARCPGWRWSPRATSPTAPCRAAATSSWPARCLLPPLRVRRRLGHARRARAEVLAATGAAGVGREDLIEKQFEPPGLGGARRGRGDLHASARATSGRRSPPSTTAAWSRCSSSTRRSTPSSSRAREMVVELDQPGAERPVRQLGLPVKLSAHAGRSARAPGPGAGRAHRARCCATPATARRRSRRSRRPAPSRAPAGAYPGASWHERRWRRPTACCKMSELAERSGVSAGTIKHYLREGLLGGDARSCARRATWPTTRRSSSSASG